LVTAEGDWPSRVAAAVNPPCSTTRANTRNAMNLSIGLLAAAQEVGDDEPGTALSQYFVH
jgi:hypothetical protein